MQEVGCMVHRCCMGVLFPLPPMPTVRLLPCQACLRKTAWQQGRTKTFRLAPRPMQPWRTARMRMKVTLRGRMGSHSGMSGPSRLTTQANRQTLASGSCCKQWQLLGRSTSTNASTTGALRERMRMYSQVLLEFTRQQGHMVKATRMGSRQQHYRLQGSSLGWRCCGGGQSERCRLHFIPICMG
jgi:hypothetical protein